MQLVERIAILGGNGQGKIGCCEKSGLSDERQPAVLDEILPEKCNSLRCVQTMLPQNVISAILEYIIYLYIYGCHLIGSPVSACIIFYHLIYV